MWICFSDDVYSGPLLPHTEACLPSALVGSIKQSIVSVCFDFVFIYTVSQKKQDTKLLPITFPNVNRFSKFFH